jgi:hypothetical protein
MSYELSPTVPLFSPLSHLYPEVQIYPQPEHRQLMLLQIVHLQIHPSLNQIYDVS